MKFTKKSSISLCIICLFSIAIILLISNQKLRTFPILLIRDSNTGSVFFYTFEPNELEINSSLFQIEKKGSFVKDLSVSLNREKIAVLCISQDNPKNVSLEIYSITGELIKAISFQKPISKIAWKTNDSFLYFSYSEDDEKSYTHLMEYDLIKETHTELEKWDDVFLDSPSLSPTQDLLIFEKSDILDGEIISDSSINFVSFSDLQSFNEISNSIESGNGETSVILGEFKIPKFSPDGKMIVYQADASILGLHPSKEIIIQKLQDKNGSPIRETSKPSYVIPVNSDYEFLKEHLVKPIWVDENKLIFIRFEAGGHDEFCRYSLHQMKMVCNMLNIPIANGVFVSWD